MKTTCFIICLLLVSPVMAGQIRLAEEALSRMGDGTGLAESGTTPFKGVKNPVPKEGNHRLNTGFTFPAVLETAIFSYNLLTPAVAVTDMDIEDRREVVIPRGARLIGEVQVVHTLDRVNILFHTLVFPDGQEAEIRFLALSLDGSAGIKGKVRKHKDAVAAKIAMKAVFQGVNTAAQTAPTVEAAMTEGLTQDAIQTLDAPSPKTLESISIPQHTAILLFNRRRLEY